jgi:hypothetical protein
MGRFFYDISRGRAGIFGCDLSYGHSQEGVAPNVQCRRRQYTVAPDCGDILKVPGRKVNALDDRLKELMTELGNAINESLSDSDRIASAIGEIKRAGYDVFLVLEATIGFNKRDESADEEGDEAKSEPTRFESAGKIKLTTQDQKFLREMNIAFDEEAR